MTDRKTNGQFAKGNKGKPKGSPNKVTKELRDKLKAILSDELENLPAILANIEGKERIELVVKLLPYAMPKVQPLTPDYDIFSEAEMAWGRQRER